MISYCWYVMVDMTRASHGSTI